MPPEPVLGIILLSGSYERAHYAFMLATGAAAIGRGVVVFATNAGCHALSRDWSVLDGGGMDAVERDASVRAVGVAGLQALLEAAGELGVRLLACDSGLRIARLRADALLPGVEVAGVPTFLSAVGSGQVVTF